MHSAQRTPGFLRTILSGMRSLIQSSVQATRPFSLSLKRLGINGWPLYLNFYDIMYVIACKR